uniref:Uncharacterized protein n=1 Tax=Eptatretus burgeri TaxID=7764 RepID=A0A8C4N3U6_EPTBU
MEAAMRCFIIVLWMLVAINVQNIGFAFGKVLREIHQVRPGVWAFNQSEPIVHTMYLIGNMDVEDLMFTLWSLQLAIHDIAMTLTLFEILLVILFWFYKQYNRLNGNDQDEEDDWEDVEDDEDCGICANNRITTFDKKAKRSAFGRTKKPRLKKCTAPGCVDLTPETCAEYLPLHSTQLPCKNTVEKEVDPQPEKTTFYKCLLGSDGSFDGHLNSDEDVNNDIKNHYEVVDDWVKEPLVHNEDVDNQDVDNEVVNNGDDDNEDVDNEEVDNGDVDNEVKKIKEEVVDDWVKEPLVHNGDVDNEVKSNVTDIADDCVKEKLFDNEDVDNGDVDNDVKNIEDEVVDDCVKEPVVDNGDVNNEVKSNNTDILDDCMKEPVVDNGNVNNEVKSNNTNIPDDCVEEKVFDNGDVDNEDKKDDEVV